MSAHPQDVRSFRGTACLAALALASAFATSAQAEPPLERGAAPDPDAVEFVFPPPEAPAPEAPPPARIEAPPRAAPPPASPSDPMRDWTEKERRWFDPSLRRLSASPTGETGLRNAMSASPGTPGLRLGLATEWFTSKDFLVAGDRNTRLAGALTASWVSRRAPFLEVFGLYRNVSNRNTKNDPELMLTQGDLQFGAKVGWTLPFAALREALMLGADFSLSPRVAVNDLVVSPAATSVELRGLATFDARRLWRFVPVIAHLNLGYASPARITGVDGAEPSCIEQFATGASRYHRAMLSLGVEAPLPYLTPYLEGHVELPMSAALDDAGCAVGLNPDRALSYGKVLPAVIAAGVRVTALRDLTFDLGSEFGLTRFNVAGIRPTPGYNVFASVTYAFDPWKAPEIVEVVRETVTVKVETREVEKRVEVIAPPTTGQISGTLVDAATGTAIEGAIVSFPGAGLPPVATDAGNGRYQTHELPPGPQTLTVRHPRFVPQTVNVTVVAGAVQTTNLRLTRIVLPGRVRGSVRDAKGAPIAGARITISGRNVTTAVTDAQGVFAQELASGAWRVQVEADQKLAKAVRVRVSEGEQAVVEVVLDKKRPAKSAVVVTDKRLELTRKIAFAVDKATLKPEVSALLDEVLDALARLPAERRLQVSGHVHDKVKPDRQEPLSRERAQAVRDYLVAQGLPTDLVEVTGRGASMPLGPNLTAKNRDRNERVELEFVSPSDDRSTP